MEELLFRGSQELESAKIQAELVASKTKDLIYSNLQHTKALVIQVLNSNKVESLKQNITQLINYLIEISKDFKKQALDVADVKRLLMFVSRILGGKWTQKEVGLICTGFLMGSIVGIAVGLAIRKKEAIVRYMEAVQIENYLGIESALVVEDAIAPYECGDYDVLINVKAASVQIIDAQICCGYGRNFRRILRSIYNESSSGLPVILGRDCSGVITDLGRNVKRLEIGDEVWVSVPFWSQGTLCQTVLVSENRVARKPKNVGFEGACSIPYAGSLALSVLTEANIDFTNAEKKRLKSADSITKIIIFSAVFFSRFFIEGGCTPVGCVLIQLLSSWQAHVTTTCYKKAVPVAQALGATDIIGINETQVDRGSEAGPSDISKALLKELEIKDEIFDVIILTKNDNLERDDLVHFCKKNGIILCAAPQELTSDQCGVITRLILAGYLRLKFLIQRALSLPLDDYAEGHFCHATLDRLTELVEEGVLQTVVDKVYHPRDIEAALNHIQSPFSIGSTVITFR